MTKLIIKVTMSLYGKLGSHMRLPVRNVTPGHDTETRR